MLAWHLLLFLGLSTCLVASEEFDPADLVVDIKLKNKKNKEITGLSQEEKDYMVKAHNAYRSLVQPYGANMIEVTWDDDIAKFAQDWANECTATHRTDRNLGSWVNMGENLYWLYSGGYHEGKAIKFWWDEVQHYTLSTKACNDVCGHYVTMVWGKTEKIGCGVARCDRLWDLPDYGRGAYYFVCNYSGRFLSNTKPYQATDIPCSACYTTGDYPKCRNNLCVTNDILLSGEGYDGATDIVGLYRAMNVTDEPDEPGTTTQLPTTQGPTTTPQELTTTPQEPTTTPQEPTTTPQEPTTTPQEPTTTPQEPTTSPQEPTTTPQEPSTTPQEPTTTPQEPTTTPQEPTTTPQEPTTTPPEPTTTPQEPTTTPQEHITTPEEVTTTPENPTSTQEPTSAPTSAHPTTPRGMSTTTMRLTTDETWATFSQVDKYCRERQKDYVRTVCWRLNNMLRKLLGYPEVKPGKKRNVDENEFEIEGGKIGVSESTPGSMGEVANAFVDVDEYCRDMDSKYKKRVCRKLDNKMKEIMGVTVTDEVTERRR